MNVQLMDNPDAGARIISPNVALSESRPLGLHPTFLIVEPKAGRAVAGFGDGSIKGISLTMEGAMVSSLTKLDATPLAAHVDVGGKGVLVGTDAGQLLKISDGTTQELFILEGDWVEAIAVHDGKALRAFSARRTLVVLDADGQTVLTADSHPSTLAGISFSPDGDWIAVAHYGGVTVWNLDEPEAEAVRLEWHGSHTAVAWSPSGTFIVTAMQDKEMHCWRWSDRKGMRMSGYPSKIRNISWTADSRFIAASGADSVTSWDCSGNGPSGKPPLCL